MLHINILCIGKVKETFFRDAINEYSKRLSKYCVLKIQELPDEKVPLKLNNKISYSIKDKESKAIISSIPKDSYIICLDLNGKQILNVEYDQIQIPGNYILATKNGNSETYDLSGTKQEDLRYANVLKTANENYSITIDTNDKYGVISKDGNTLIENKYNYIQYLYDNYFIVGGDSGKSGIVNDKGEEILSANYEVIQKLDNSDIIQAMAGNVLELYNKQMSKIISMEDGKLDIKNNYIKVYSATQTAYVSLDGSIKTDFEIFPENILFASEKDGKWGFVDKNNNVKIDYQYDKVTELNELGFAGIKKDGKWGVIDKEGNIILEPTYTIPEQNGEPYFIGKYYKVISGYEEEYFTDDINE